MSSGKIWSRDPSVALSWLGAGATVLGFGLPLWLMFATSLTAGLLNVAAPLAALLAVRFRPELTFAATQASSHRIRVSSLWYAPSIALGLWSLRANLVDGFAPLPVVAALALAMLVAVLLVDPAARRWGVAIVALALAWSWAWGSIVGLNVAMDRSAPRIVVGQVVEARAVRGFRYLTIQARPGFGETFAGLLTSPDVFDRHPTGSTACVAIRAGRLRWRHADAIDCPAGAT